MNTYYAIQQADKELNINIFGELTSWPVFPGEVSSNDLAGKIEKFADVDQINVHINSYGGEVAEGWAIYNALKNHPAKVITYGDGFVASAALFPFMAGDERRASNLSVYYFHEVMQGAFGYASDLRAAADEIDQLTDIGIKAFVGRTKMNAEEVRELMKNETWLSPERALELGVATSIIADEGTKYTQNAKRAIMQRMMTSGQNQTATHVITPPSEEIPPETPPAKQPGHSIMQKLSGFFDTTM